MNLQLQHSYEQRLAGQTFPKKRQVLKRIVSNIESSLPVRTSDLKATFHECLGALSVEAVARQSNLIDYAERIERALLAGGAR